MKKYLILNLFLVLFCRISLAQKPRVFVLTDIENEPDDAMSYVRFLTYANQFDTEGIVATTSCWQRTKTAEWRLHDITEAYGKVRDNLEIHEGGYPTEKFIHSIIKKGLPVFGKEGLGEGKDSEGSEWLIQSMLKNDTRPLYIQAWGGTNVLAQALWKLRRTIKESELARVITRLRVYTISDQDDTGPWIRKNFPGLFYVVSPGFEENGGGQYHYATWSGISGDIYHGRFSGADTSIVRNKSLDQHVRQNHGALGDKYPKIDFLMEGDSPAFLGLINNGLNDPEHPDYGSWGGRYELYIPPFRKYMYEPETRPIWTDTQDEVYSDITKSYHTSNHATIWRWRKAFQHDFFARMDWCVAKKYSEANHPPKVSLNHPNEITAKSGEEVVLSGLGTDPDNNTLQYSWMHYKEPGSLAASRFVLKNSVDKEVKFTAPPVTEARTMHFILEVSDNGTPSLTRYQRVIVNVIPK
ncbi:DUF1593 domain-containing protein [Emticicia sp. CRIBPO]|uniref:DUF1593 domain-containing protein n=1 Tax=Emticicia sp. CRIBPO TaxID=2683258 RepID=UPI001411C6C1|nr:DUF1593 domain-containing protein [Emticicia sp. CRIBPO]NBA85217.1 DUF1593 domain-containing protein [Emticicia sp. CRIBPO]